MTVYQPEGPGNHVAPEGHVFVCNACGKRSRDKYGEMKIDPGWDEACMMEAVLCAESSLVFDDNGRLKGAQAVPYAEAS